MARKYPGWKDPPPVALVSGSETFLRLRQVQMAVAAASLSGRKVQRLHAADKEALRDTLSGVSIFAAPVLVVITSLQDVDPDSLQDVDPELIAAHVAGDDNTVSLLLVFGKDLPASGPEHDVAEKVPKSYCFAYKKPPDFKAAEVAVAFTVDEAKRRDLVITDPLAKSLVERVGTDLGVLHWEVCKLATYLKARGEGPRIEPAHVRDIMLRLGEVDVQAVVDALGAASEKRVLKALGAVRANASEDPTMMTVRWLANRATVWLHVATLNAQGASEGEGCSRTGLKPYPYTHINLPIARRWGTSRLVQLLERLASVENSITKGYIDPWSRLESLLASSCRRVVSGG